MARPLSQLQIDVLKRMVDKRPGTHFGVSFESLSSMGLSPSTLPSLRARELAFTRDGNWHFITDLGRQVIGGLE